MSTARSGITGSAHVALVRARFGLAPPPHIVTANPEHEWWIENAALFLCVEADEAGRIPTPCADHLREARQIAQQMAWVLS